MFLELITLCVYMCGICLPGVCNYTFPLQRYRSGSWKLEYLHYGQQQSQKPEQVYKERQLLQMHLNHYPVLLKWTKLSCIYLSIICLSNYLCLSVCGYAFASNAVLFPSKSYRTVQDPQAYDVSHTAKQ